MFENISTVKSISNKYDILTEKNWKFLFLFENLFLIQRLFRKEWSPLERLRDAITQEDHTELLELQREN